MPSAQSQACTSCLRAFSIFRSEHQCGLCGEMVCRKCLTKDSGSRFRSLRRSRTSDGMKVCRLCDGPGVCAGTGGIYLMTAQPCPSWQFSPAWNTPAQRTTRSASSPAMRTPAYTFTSSMSCRDIRQPWRRDIFARSDRKLDAMHGLREPTVGEDDEIMTLNTDDMTKVSSSPMFLSRINSSICEQREILRWMQHVAQTRRAHAKTA